MPNKITQEQMDDLKFEFEHHRKSFPKTLEEYTGIVAKPYIAYQYFSERGDYICDSDSCSLENLMEEMEIEVVADA